MATVSLTPKAYAYRNWSYDSSLDGSTSSYVGYSSGSVYYTRISYPSFWSATGLTKGKDSVRITSITVPIYSNDGYSLDVYAYTSSSSTFVRTSSGDGIVSGQIGDNGSDQIATRTITLTSISDTILGYTSNFYLFLRPQNESYNERVQIRPGVTAPVITITYEIIKLQTYINGEWVSTNPKIYKDGQWKDVRFNFYKDGVWKC